jgi:hypothetical protein
MSNIVNESPEIPEVAEEPSEVVAEEPVAEEPSEVVVEEPVAEEPVAEEPSEVVAEEPSEVVAEEPSEVVAEEPSEVVAEVVVEVVVEEPAEIVSEEPIEVPEDKNFEEDLPKIINILRSNRRLKTCNKQLNLLNINCDYLQNLINILKPNWYLYTIDPCKLEQLKNENTRFNNLIDLLKTNKHVNFISNEQWNSI